MNIPTITPKQQTIIQLIYRYRFLERKQIQAFLGHTDKRRVSAWLKELREKQFIDWLHESNAPGHESKPAIYFLSINGIRLLRQFEDYPEEELRKRYKEPTRQQDFISRCLLLTDCCLHLEARNKDDDGVAYSYVLEADYLGPGNDYYFLSESEYIHPHLCFVKEEDTDEGLIGSTYLLEIFDLTTPRYMVKKNLRGYVDFFDDSDEWEDARSDEELPIILIACPSIAELAYAKRYAKKFLNDHDLQDREDVRIRFATIEQVRKSGVTALIWEEA